MWRTTVRHDVYIPPHPLHISSKWWYLEADHGEVGPHHRVKVVENVGFTQRILRLRQVTQLHRGEGEREGGKEGRGEGEEIVQLQYSTELCTHFRNLLHLCE